MSDLLGSLLRFVLKLVLGAMALVFAVSLLLAALLVVAFTVVKALLTGKKPAPAMVFGRFRQYSPQDIWRRSPSPTAASEVVDVEVRDITNGSTPAAATEQTLARPLQAADNISDVLPKKRIQPAD